MTEGGGAGVTRVEEIHDHLNFTSGGQYFKLFVIGDLQAKKPFKSWSFVTFTVLFIMKLYTAYSSRIHRILSTIPKIKKTLNSISLSVVPICIM